jgi:hypothetical protein
MYPKSEKQLSKEDKDVRKFIVRNVADDLFSLVQGPRSQYYGVLGHERRKARNIYPWLTDGMLDHQLKKLKKIQKRGVAFGALQANTTVDPLLICDLQSIASDAARTAGRPAGSTTDASKTLDDRKRKAFDDAATIYYNGTYGSDPCAILGRGERHSTRLDLMLMIRRFNLKKDLVILFSALSRFW